MTPFDGFVLGAAAVAIAAVLLLSLAGAVAKRVHARRERQRADDEVRAAFVRLAKQMAQVERAAKSRWDMPMFDRLREAQCGQLVSMGLTIKKAPPGVVLG